MLRAYVDQNFLINCANSTRLHDRAMNAWRTAAVSFVLSPWHLYEIGKLDRARADELIQIAESLQPAWILDRSDLQLGEFLAAWNSFYGFPQIRFRPIGTLAEMGSVLLRASHGRLAKLTLRDYVRVFQVRGTENISPVLDEQESIAAKNQVSVQEGLMTAEMKNAIHVAYVTLMLARSRETESDHEKLRDEEAAIRRDSFTMELIKHFVHDERLRELRAWQVESLLTDRHHTGRAKLNHHRQIDRQHAVMGLAYCDRFITDDKELLRLCGALALKLSFSPGIAQTSYQFLDSFEG